MTSHKKGWLILGAFLALFILSRILFLSFVYPAFFSGEDRIRGVIAEDIISGKLNQPLSNYRADTYSGGSLVVGLLAVPYFLLWGSSAFVLKLVGLSFFALSLVVWFLFCLRFFNLKTAIFFSALFIFSPLFFTKMSLTTMGFHSESILFSAVAVFLFYKIFFERKNHWLYFFTLGIVFGFGLWFTYIFGITLTCCLICWFFFDRRFLARKEFLIFSCGFLLGFSPWIQYNLTHQFQGLIVQEIPLSRFFAISNLLKIFDFRESVIRDIPASLGLSKIWIFDKKLLSGFYFLIFIAAFLSLFRKGRKNLAASKEFFFIVYCLILGVFYQSAFMRCERYLITIYPFIFMIIALFLSRLWEAGAGFKRTGSVVLIFFLALLGFFSNMSAVSAKYAGYGLKAKGYSYTLWYNSLGYADGLKSQVDLSGISSRFFCSSRNIDADYVDAYAQGFIESLKFESLKDVPEVFGFTKQIIKNTDQKYRRYLYQRVGGEVGIRVKYEGIDKAKQFIAELEPEYQRYIYEAWVDTLVFSKYIGFENKKRIVARIGPGLYPYFYRVLGEQAGIRHLDVKNSIEQQYLPEFFEGVGISISRELYLDNARDIKGLIKPLDERYQPFVCRGIGEGIALQVKEDPDNILIWDRLLTDFPLRCQEYCREGAGL